MSLKFITLQTASHEDRKVSISLSDKDHVYLLGNLVHQTKFKRSDLVRFASEILRELGGDQAIDHASGLCSEACDLCERESESETEAYLSRMRESDREGEA